MTRTRILVLCTGNSCRSQMAEGFLRHYGGDKVEVYSAGLEPKGVHPLAIKVMAEIEMYISHQTSKHVNEFVGQKFDYVITVCDNAAKNCPVFPGAETKLHWPFDDPAGATGGEEEILAVFRRVRDEIGIKTMNWLEKKGVPRVQPPDRKGRALKPLSESDPGH
jgi:arsenate reductase